jgi:L-seryl-tRNA(Ser) seleniumtransferase
LSSASQRLYSLLPQIGELLERDSLVELQRHFSRSAVTEAARAVVAEIRREIAREDHDESFVQFRIRHLEDAVRAKLNEELRPSLRRVLNATGVILHTGLGRAPLSQPAIRHISEVAAGYCNLELDLATGERGRRDDHAENLLLRVLAQKSDLTPEEITARYGAVIVNNCAAATMLALNSLAEAGEVIVSRGELVEIGGGFRVPEIMAKSGALLREVGTTNRTRISDYERAIGPNTRLILRVHQSNFRMEGFVERPELEALCAVAAARGIPLFEDQGTGSLLDLSSYGTGGEPTITQSIRAGVSVIAASGDKLLGGPQCGLLVFLREFSGAIRKNPLLRAFRVDKLTYAALESTLRSYLLGRESELPLVSMLAVQPEEIEARCEALRSRLRPGLLHAEVVPVESVIGGGTSPGATLPSFALALSHASHGAEDLTLKLRTGSTPVLARVVNDRVVLDLRTIPPEDDATLEQLLTELEGHE